MIMTRANNEMVSSELAERVRSLLAELDGGGGGGDGPTLRVMLERHANNRVDLTAGSRELDEMAARYLRFHFGDERPAASITPADAADWFGALSRGVLDGARKRSDGHPPDRPTALKHLQRAKTAFAEAVRDGLLIRNPFDALSSRQPVPARDWRYVSDPEIEMVIAAARSAGWRALIGLCRWAALRVGEALDLCWPDVDLDGTPPRIVVRATKTRRHRPVRVAPVKPQLARLLVQAGGIRTDSTTRHGGRVVGSGIDRNNLRRDFRAIIKRAGLEPWSKPFHTLRKNCATDWMGKYRELAVVADWLGHDPAVSRAHYLTSQSEQLLALESAGEDQNVPGPGL